MAGEKMDAVDNTKQNSTESGASQVDDRPPGADSDDDDLNAGFTSGRAGEASPQPEGQGQPGTADAETAGATRKDGVAAAPAPGGEQEPEIMRVTRAEWDALIGRVNGVDDVKRQLASVNGRVGEFAKRLDGSGQVVEVTADDFPELKEDFPELVAAQVQGVNNALKKARLTGGGISQEVFEREVARASDTARREAVNVHLDNIVDGDWTAEVKTPEFQAFKAANTEVATLCASPEPRDAAKALRAWVKHKTAAAPSPSPSPARTSTRTQQLTATVTPKGSAAAPVARGSEDDGFDEGFKTGRA